MNKILIIFFSLSFITLDLNPDISVLKPLITLVLSNH